MLRPPTLTLWRVTLFSSFGTGLLSGAAGLAPAASSAASTWPAKHVAAATKTRLERRFMGSSFVYAPGLAPGGIGIDRRGSARFLLHGVTWRAAHRA